MQRILEDQDVKLAVLAENIVNRGGLNPMDRWLVLKEGDSTKYTVYEGNRRLTALKILSNPTVLGGLEIRPALRKRFERAAAKFNQDEFGKIDCFVIADRAEGAMWLHQRHTGHNRGSGIVGWGGVATARFRGTDPALQALEMVLKLGVLDEETREEIEDFPITTLDRLLSSTTVRASIGFDVKQGKLITDLPAPAAVRIMSRIVRDLSSGKITVSAVKNKADQAEYVKTLGEDLPDLAMRTGQWIQVEELEEKIDETVGQSGAKNQSDSGSGPDAKPGGNGQAQAKSSSTQRRRSVERKVLITRDCVLNVTNPKVAEIEKELRILQLASHRHAIAVLFRVFLETSLDCYLTSKGVPLTVVTGGGHVKDKSLAVKVREAIEQLVSEGVPAKHLDGVSKGINDRNNPIYIDTLHAYVHNSFYSPKESDLTVAFDNAQPFFQAIWK